MNFPSNEPIGNPAPFDLSRPPPLPQVQIPPTVHQFAALITTTFANVLITDCRKNAARTYAYNAISHNNYQNGDFAEIIQLGMDYLAMKLSQNAVTGDIGSYILDLATTLIKFKTSTYVTQFPSLLAAAGNAFEHHMGIARQDVAQYQGLWQQVGQWKNRGQQPQGYGYPQQPQGNMPGYGGGGGGYPQQAYNTPGYGNPHQQPVHRATPGIGGGMSSLAASVFSNDRPGAPPQSSLSNPLNADRALVTAQLRGEARPAAQAPAPAVQAAPAPAAPAKWQPSSNQRHPPIVDATTEAVVLTSTSVSPGQSPIPIYQVVNLTKEQQMERDKHILTGATGKVAAYVPPTQVERLEGVVSSLTSLARNEDKLAQCLKELYYVDPERDTVASNLDQAIAAARFIHKAYKGEETSATAMRIDAVFSHVLITANDYSARITELRTCRNFAAVAQRMNAALESAHEPQEYKELIYKLDRWLTDRLNDLLYNGMSVMTVTIDSFCTDHKKLFDYLRDNQAYGQLYVDKLTKHQPDFINDWLDFKAGNKIFAGLDGLDFDKPEYKKPVVHSVDNHVSITCIEVLYDELHLGFPALTNAGEIQQTSLPVLHEYANKLLSEPRSDGPTRHFIVTLDDVILELHRGLLVEGAVLASLTDR